MEQRRIFVFRTARGQETGTPIGKCPLDYSDIKKKISEIKNEEINPIDYSKNGHMEFVQSELRQRNILRQGWGIKGLDLRLPIKKWIENYMYFGKIYWNGDISCNEAKGRRNILRRMLDMHKGDILLIPKTSKQSLNDYNSFTVCKVETEYVFDYQSDYEDFGHCIGITELKDFRFDKNTLERSDFGSPYLWAITEVKSSHSRFEKFIKFIDNEYSH